MAKLVETRVTEVYRARCPHCRPTQQGTKEATVTVLKKSDGSIIDVWVECDWATTGGQDRT